MNEGEKLAQQLENLNAQTQMLAMEKQRFEFEIEQMKHALEHLEKTNGKAFKAVGAFLLEAKPEDLKKEIKEKLEKFEERIKTLEKQEQRINSKKEEIQKKLKEMTS